MSRLWIQFVFLYITTYLGTRILSCNYTENVAVGGMAKIKCFNPVTQMRPLGTLSLIKESHVLVSLVRNEDKTKYILDNDTYIVRVMNTSIIDNGTYTCHSADASFIDKILTTCLFVYASPRQTTVSTTPTMNSIAANHMLDVMCQIPVVYPSNSLYVYILSGNSIIKQSAPDNYRMNSDGTFSASLTKKVKFKREYNTNQLFCRVDYNGGINSTINSSKLEVEVHFPPSSNTISPATSETLHVGVSKTFRCVTDSLYPLDRLVMVWKKGMVHNNGDLHIHDDVNYTYIEGDFGGKIITSTYMFTAAREDNNAYVTCVPKWNEGSSASEISDLAQSQQLNVLYPPDVSVTGCDTVTEGRDCTLACETTDGNPIDSITHQWQFKEKFTNSFISLDITNNLLVLNNASYRDAGIYKCIASNTAGDNNGLRHVLVRYAPKGIDFTNGRKSAFPDHNKNVELEVKVKCYPNVTTFEWRKDNNIIEDVAVQRLQNDATRSTLSLQNLERSDYGEYEIVVSNGVDGSRLFVIELKQQSKPEKPTRLQVESRSYRQIIISFMPGLDGGFMQTISTEIRVSGASSYNGLEEKIVNPDQGETQEVKISENLDAATKYSIRLVADNSYNQSDAAVSDPITVETRGKPTFNNIDLKTNYEREKAVLSWGKPDGDITAIEIQQCHKRSNSCMVINVTDQTKVTLNNTDGERFTLVMYQDRDRVFMEQFPISERTLDDGDGGTPDVTIGVIVVAIVVVVLTVILGVLIYKRRADPREKNRPTDDAVRVVDDITDTGNPNGDTANAAAADNPAAMYAPVNWEGKKKKPAQETSNRDLTPPAQADNIQDMYAKVQKRQQTNGAPAPSQTPNQPQNTTPKPTPKQREKRPHGPPPTQPSNVASPPNQPPRPAPPRPGTKPKPGSKGEYSNVLANPAGGQELGDNPYSNTQEIQAEQEQLMPQAYEDQNPYANVGYGGEPEAKEAASADNPGLVYADLSFAEKKSGGGATAKPPIIHGQGEGVEYATVDFSKQAEPPQDSESEDEEDVRRRQQQQQQK